MNYNQALLRQVQKTVVTVLVMFCFSAITLAQSNGLKVYEANCKSCHFMDRKMTGPMLDGAFDRIKAGHEGFDDAQTRAWLVDWIKNSKAVISSGDAYANALYNEYNKTEMTAFLALPDEDVEAVIDYIQDWQDCEKYPDAPNCTEVGPTNPVAVADNSGFMKWLMIILVGVLLVIALVLTRVTGVLGRMSKEKEGEYVAPEPAIWKNKKVLAVIAILVVAVVGYKAADGAISLGRQQNYAPTQPIKFSHKVHAGNNQIDCKYCHVGVEKGKQATIPSVNVCMNCHKTVTSSSINAWSTSEIAKIHDAAGYDVESGAYDYSKAKPVEWVRIHNLPDHVFFSHAQHVKAGQLECQECHGPVEEMEVMKQHSPLSMGWCINCHRETEVQFGTNDYYPEHYKAFHDKLESGEMKGVTVEDIGGTECQKCHY